MERMTKKIDRCTVFPEELVGVTLVPDNPIMCKLLLRLAAYEDTGLTPGDVEELIKMATSKTNKVLQLKEELQGAKNTAEQYAAINETLFDSNMKLGAERKALINELCQYCGKYKQAHEGACDGCRWREK